MTTEFQREQEDRRETLLNDARVREQQQTSTMHQHAQAQADELSQGRFRATGTPNVIGADATPAYPAGPAWCAADQSVEPPLGIDVDAMEPTGEPHELKASVPTLEQLSPFSSAQGNSPSPASDVDPSSPLDVERRDAGLGLSDQQDDGNA